jgi:hypothetical protein
MISMDINLHLRFKNTRTGKTGTLTTDGRFFPCEYGQHDDDKNLMIMYALASAGGNRSKRLANESIRDFVHRMGFITMGSKGPGEEVFSHMRYEGEEKMTDNQVQWLVTHYKELDEMQQQLLKDFWKEMDILVEIPEL